MQNQPHIQECGSWRFQKASDSERMSRNAPWVEREGKHSREKTRASRGMTENLYWQHLAKHSLSLLFWKLGGREILKCSFISFLRHLSSATFPLLRKNHLMAYFSSFPQIVFVPWAEQFCSPHSPMIPSMQCPGHLITPLPPEERSPPCTPPETCQGDGVVISLVVKPSQYIHPERHSGK